MSSYPAERCGGCEEEATMITHKPTSLADQIFANLESDILTGVYPRGSVLTELGLSERLGVSRTPVREALKIGRAHV